LAYRVRSNCVVDYLPMSILPRRTFQSCNVDWHPELVFARIRQERKHRKEIVMEKTCLVLVTVPTQETAAQIGMALVEEHLAACVNILPGIRSIYWWDGQINDEPEVMLVIKTRLDLVDNQIIPRVRAVHPYTEPEIIAFPIEKGSSSYLEWIVRESKQIAK
jgi:periplasmic divalent cation tolerance protein